MKLDNKKTITVGFAFLAISAFWQVYDNIIPLILKYFFEIGDTLSGAIMALDNIFALIMLPLFGAWSDKVSHKRGKRTPFIFVGTVMAVVFMLLLPIAANGRNLIFFIVVLLLTLISMSIFRSPAVSLMPDVTPKPLRSKGNAIINLMGAIGIILALGLIMALVGEGQTPDYEPLFIAIAVIMILSLLIVLFKVDENKMVAERIEIERQWGIADEEEAFEESDGKMPKDIKRSLVFLLLSVAFWYMAYNAVTTAFSKYATQMWGMEGGSFAGALMVASVGALVSFIPVGIISSKFGRKKVILFGVALLAFSFLSGVLFEKPNFAINIMFFLVGVAWASINVNSYPMVVEMCKGSDIGKFTGMYYTFSMAAQVLTPVLSGAFLEHVGYWTLFPYAAIFSAAAFCTMLMVKHGDSKPDALKSKLEAFDIDD
ncbi:MAG: SLC45 family MFS transporter [Firmicutes bacterium]|jgi:maltose/moltooligosaccharide transporter|nr:SLC45 family MFS transporter [Bacillota bacterium]